MKYSPQSRLRSKANDFFPASPVAQWTTPQTGDGSFSISLYGLQLAVSCSGSVGDPMKRFARLLLFLLLLVASTCLNLSAQIAEAGDGKPGCRDYASSHSATRFPHAGHRSWRHRVHWTADPSPRPLACLLVNAGDAGAPPRVNWTLPKGISAGPLQFPPPSAPGAGAADGLRL